MTWGIADNPDGTRQAGGPFEIQVERAGWSLGVRYRERGTRRWTYLLLTPDIDSDASALAKLDAHDALHRKVVPAVEAHATQVAA